VRTFPFFNASGSEAARLAVKETQIRKIKMGLSFLIPIPPMSLYKYLEIWNLQYILLSKKLNKYIYNENFNENLEIV